MRSFVASVLGLVSLLALAAPAGAIAQYTRGSHITVQTCLPHRGRYTHVRNFVDVYGNMQTVTEPGRPSTLEIHYKNNGKVTATEIDFGLSARNVLVAQVKDVGKFSPTILIDHEFDIPHDVFPLGTGLPQCVVLSVKYVDGTSWTNPNPPQP